ncbi:DUF3105 domain-containing protein [Streptomyces sp. NPDC000927]|uniref:DUF3105 domain-containing protein n=1 Tax=Streptomyces sp. NPDC000927 TaxID=3154371 RepID=UPI003322B287
MQLGKKTPKQEQTASKPAKGKKRTRKTRITIGVAAAVGAAMIASGAWGLIGKFSEKHQPGTIEGIRTWSDLGRNHTTESVEYPMRPPAGGDHNPVWLKCEGTLYTKEVREENAVHSLEHGAVWVTYNDKASAADVGALKKLVASTNYTLMSPYEGQKSPITLTAWGHQLGVDHADDPRVGRFFREYVQGMQTPEPYASCEGGYMRQAPTKS